MLSAVAEAPLCDELGTASCFLMHAALSGYLFSVSHPDGQLRIYDESTTLYDALRRSVRQGGGKLLCLRH